MVHVGANIYCWGDAEQDRLLLTGLRHWAIEARRRRLAGSFWFSRFDARGPHIFALFGTSEKAEPQLRSYLAREIRAFCLETPSLVTLSEDELERRHQECRGKFLCAVDRAEDIAANNSFIMFRHDTDGYPLRLSTGMQEATQFWARMNVLTFWTLEKLGSGGVRGAAARWLAAVDHALDRAGVPACAYWRHHACSLIPALNQSVERGPEETSALLRRAIGDRNGSTFSTLWSAPQCDFDVEELVTLVARNGRTLRQRFQVLREVTHAVLGRLVSVESQIPMVLYAWQRRLTD